jgi:hypothetical protein
VPTVEQELLTIREHLGQTLEKPKVQLRMDNPDKLPTEDKNKQNKKTQHNTLDTTIHSTSAFILVWTYIAVQLSGK